jgi:hypothetical protein
VIDAPAGVIVAFFCLAKSTFLPVASRAQIPKLVTSIWLVEATVALAVTVPPLISARSSIWENGEPARAISATTIWLSSSAATATRIRTLRRLICTPRRSVLHRALRDEGPSMRTSHWAARANHGQYSNDYNP